MSDPNLKICTWARWTLGGVWIIVRLTNVFALLAIGAIVIIKVALGIIQTCTQPTLFGHTLNVIGVRVFKRLTLVLQTLPTLPPTLKIVLENVEMKQLVLICLNLFLAQAIAGVTEVVRLNIL